MCGIAGSVNLGSGEQADVMLLRRMLGMLHHRGPDSTGCYVDRRAQLGSARLSIIDHAGGQQPIHNEDESLWLVFNGEIYNYIELREELVARGHHFYTDSDTEVIVHLYEERGPSCLHALNGQFAIALWDRRRQELFLARDRLGVRPLFYTEIGGALRYASEIKALFVDPRVSREIDPVAIDQVFTFWSTLPGRTMFHNVHQVPPGHYLSVKDGCFALKRYWRLQFSCGEAGLSEDDYAGQLRELLVDATRLRLRADVPVGAYLSGGLDSSITAAIVKNYTSNRLRTFSITFADARYDEAGFQHAVARHLGTEHQHFECTGADIARCFPEVVWHAEMPLLRTAPAPFYLLSEMVHDAGLKVVLTGEGADELLGGYDIFKETMIRRFWARQPHSRLRPLLLRRMYGFVPDLQRGPQPYLEAFFRPGLEDVDNPFYSHLIRWENTRRLKRLYSQEMKATLAGYDPFAELGIMLEMELGRWHPLARAQYLEITTFLSEYLLSSQGDRMAMAHSVEGRFPYLDHRVVELCNQLPPQIKLRGLEEKHLLKRSFGDLIPGEVIRRVKQPYRSPISGAFLGDRTPDYVEELLCSNALASTGYFAPAAVARLVQKCRVGTPSEWDNMALVGVLSLQLLHGLFNEEFRRGRDGAIATPTLLVIAEGENMADYGVREACLA
ncbi:MAG: asparagine synthase (glutamine-hydrolyzing) [Chloroflexi bacterium]|nr:asparagine synthase (glutamine-hydrolyzing) [Chloroflexota bacterium]